MRRRFAILAAALLTAATPLFGQPFRIIPKEVLDSLANPQAAADSPVHFAQTTLDLGRMAEEGGPVSGTLCWENTGSEPLVVTELRTGCGCVTADFDRRPVKPGGQQTVKLTYHPKGHPGHFRRTIRLFTQTERQPAAVLTLTGEVIPAVQPTHDYPHAMGPLRLKQRQVRLHPAQRSIERIEVLNAGREPLTLRAAGALVPPCITLRCDPATIEPGAAGDLEIAFDPAQAPAKMPGRLPLLLEGFGEAGPAPHQRTIYLLFGEETE